MATVELFSVHTATLFDALGKAQRIAPTKGAAYDKAAGFHLTIDGASGTLQIRATDLEVSFLQTVPATVGMLDSSLNRSIRLPSKLLHPFIQSLPMAGEHSVRFMVDDETESCTVQHGKTKLKARMSMIAGEYPKILEYPLSGMSEAQPLASLLEQVAWSTDADSPTALRGVHIDGKRLIAASQTRAAVVDCEVPIDSPLTVGLSTLAPLVKMGTRIRIRAAGGRLQLALDETTQLTTTIFEDPFPDIIDRLDSFELPNVIRVSKSRCLDALGRLKIFAANDRIPRMRCQLTSGTMLLSLVAAGSGDVQDGIALTSHEGEDDDRDFDPDKLIEALTNFPGNVVEIHYGPTNRPFLFIDKDSSYKNWVMPLGKGA